MRRSAVVLLFALLLTCASEGVADLQIVPIDAAKPSAEFAKTFDIKIKTNGDVRTIIVSYASRPEQKITRTYADGKRVDHYTEGVVEGAQMLLHDDGGREALTAPIRFDKRRDARSSAVISIRESAIKALRIRLFIPFRPNAFCYEIHFKNVK